MSAPTETIPHDDEHWLLSEAVEEFRLLYLEGKAPKPEEIYHRYPQISAPLKEAIEAFLEAHPDPLSDSKPNSDSIQTVPPEKTPEEDFSGQLFGDYRIIRKVGSGAMGIVYEAEECKLKRRVALKITKGVKLTDIAVARFKEEASIIASLHHESIVPIFSFGEFNGRYFYAMQLIDGIPLSRIAQCPERMIALANSGVDDETLSRSDITDTRSEISSLSLQETDQLRKQKEFYLAVARVGITTARALQYAHSKGIQHFDVKPGNLLLDRQNKVWLTDFGVAEFIHAANNKKNVFGTIGYISPEVAGVIPGLSSGLSDIYSLGATLYSLATGKSTYSGPSSQYLNWLRDSEPITPRRLTAAIPRDLETIILKALEKRCEDRYQSAQELADDLTRFLSNRPIQARPPQLLDIASKALQRNRRALSIAAASLLVILSIFSVISFRLYRRAVKSEQGYSHLVFDIFRNLDDHGNLRGGNDPKIQYNRFKAICDFLEDRHTDQTNTQSETFLLAQMQYYAAIHLTNIGTNREEVFNRLRRSAQLFKAHAKISGDPLHRLDAIRSRMSLVNHMNRRSDHGEIELEIALKELEELIKDYPDDLRFLDAAAWAHNIAHSCYAVQRNHEKCKEHLLLSQSISRQLQRMNPEKWWFHAFNESLTYASFVDVLLGQNKTEEALVKANEGVELFQRIIEAMDEAGEDSNSIKVNYLINFKHKLEVLWILNRDQEFLSEIDYWDRESSEITAENINNKWLLEICSHVKLFEAEIHLRKGHIDLAKKAMQSAFSLAQNSPAVAQRLRLLNPFSSNEDFEEVLAQIRTMANKSVEDDYNSTTHFMALLKCKRFEEAVDYYESKANLSENNLLCGYLNACALREIARSNNPETSLSAPDKLGNAPTLGIKVYLDAFHREFR
jgi:serine/threonine protein kinase